MPTRSAKQPNPDAELMQLCNEYRRTRAAANNLPLDDLERFCAVSRILRTTCEIILEIPAVTQAGQRAKAAIALAQIADTVTW